MRDKKRKVYVIDKKSTMGRHMKKFIQKSIHLCGGIILGNYLNGTFKSIDKILFVTTQEKIQTFQLRSKKEYIDYSKILGFALITDKNPRTYYIDLICGSGIAKDIIDKLQEIAKKEKRNMITLSAIPEAMVTYYRKYGFVFAESACVQQRNVENLAETTKHKIESLLEKIKDTKLNMRGKKMLTLRIQYLVDNLARLLSKKQIVHMKGCKHSLNMTKNNVNTNNCNHYGYEMTKCI